MKHVIAALLLCSAMAAQAQAFADRTPEGLPMEVVKVDGALGTVIMAHGCGGPVFDRDEGWSKKFNEAGFNTIRFHSWKFRNMTAGVCLTNAITSDQRANEDVALAAAWTRQQSWHTGGLFIMGWSHGGSVALVASTKKELGFVKAAAIYPWCDNHHRTAVIPVQIHMGADDDWTPPHRCKSLYSGLFGIGSNRNGSYIEYPDATHAFDRWINVDASIQGLGERGEIRTRNLRSNFGARDKAVDAVITFFKAP